MTLNLELSRYRPVAAAEIVKWVRTPMEARFWRGHTGDLLPTVSIFEQWHKDSEVQPYLLNSESLPVAYGEIWVDPIAREVELARLIVKPSFRGQGIGRRLVDELAIVAASFGFDVTFVRVAPENQPALACYSRAGFLRVSQSDEKQFNIDQPVNYVWLHRRQNAANGSDEGS